jgi:hypothetical protein
VQGVNVKRFQFGFKKKKKTEEEEILRFKGAV